MLKMKMNIKTAVAVASLMFFFPGTVSSQIADDGLSGVRGREFRKVLDIQEAGMHSRSHNLFRNLSDRKDDSYAEGSAVLDQVVLKVPGYESAMARFESRHPHSVMIPRIRYAHAVNLFASQEYEAAASCLDMVTPSHISRKQHDVYLFMKAYCSLDAGNYDIALLRFKEIEKRPASGYTAPSRYAVGYINYERKDFHEALGWFEKSSQDVRFREISNYYIMECRFMLGDHKYVTSCAEEMYESVPQDRKPHLARIISESYLVLGDSENARKYYELNAGEEGKERTRADWFYSGSVLYAVKDYAGAVECFENMGVKADSIGQIANYHLGYSYIQTKNKVAAMEAFKNASRSAFDAGIAEDAYFNWAKLAFDLNNDTSVFDDYLRRYSEMERGDRINSYMAVAALYNHDYEGAVNAYDKIDDLDEGMRGNYMKANYLRAEQLIANGSYRKAIPCLKVSAYYSERGSRFNHLSRYWLAESYYRNGQYTEALQVYTELYNADALHGDRESSLIPYNIAYCHFMSENYPLAMEWFSKYLENAKVTYRKDALERKGDCHFMIKEYKPASRVYDVVLKDYFDVNDIYPYYQAALSYGLSGDAAKKVETLLPVLEASPSSRFYPEALFELGRSYAVKEDDDNAFKCFNMLAESVKDSTFVAKAYIEMGSLARNQSQFNEALGYYKTVVEEMPKSEFAEDALAAIESIYQTKNEPEEYLAYIEGIGKGASKTDDEKKDMIFNSAEQIFLSENYQKALVALQAYKEKYPEGKNAYKADFYIAESYRTLGRYEQACDLYKSVISDGEGSYVELSMLRFAELSYRLERWDDAFGGYSSLYASAVLENNRYVALAGMMRSAYKGHVWAEALKSAERILFDSRTDSSLKTEAEYVKAKSFLATSRRDEAFAILEKLSGDMDSAYGAEALYLIILDCYDRGEFDKVEEKVYAFSDAESGEVYWLAKSFLVLGDTFVEKGDLTQAKATFESVRDGYEPSGSSDDVLDNAVMRLAKLEELMTQN